MGKLTVTRILCPFDFTCFSREGLEMAISLARSFSARLHVLHVLLPPPAYVMAQGNYVSGILQDQQKIDRKICQLREAEIESVVNEIGGEDTHPHIVGLEGVREDLAIREYAEKIDADLIVMASHGRRGLLRFFLGSTTERVLKGAPCPVLIVRPKEARERDRLTERSDRGRS